MINDAGLFGLTQAQQMAEDSHEADIAFGNGGCMPGKCAVHTDGEAAEYTAEIMSLTEKMCPQCGCAFVGAPDEFECAGCEQAWQDHQDEMTVAMAATNGTL